MYEEKHVGTAGDIEVVLVSLSHIQLRQDSETISMNVVEAAHLAVLLDEALGLIRGGIKLGGDLGENNL